MNDPSLIESPCDLPMQYNIPNEQVFWKWEMSSEHLFAKINLANLVIWQLAKIDVKSKKKTISKSLSFGLGKIKNQAHICSTTGPGSTTAASSRRLISRRGLQRRK